MRVIENKEILMSLNEIAQQETMVSTVKKDGIVIDTTGIEDHINVWVDNNRLKKEAESKMEMAEGKILEVVQDKWIKHCKENGTVESTARVGPIRITWKGKSQFVTVSSISNDEKVRSVFDDDYNKFFVEVEEYSISQEAINNPMVMKIVEKALTKVQEVVDKKFPGIKVITRKKKIVSTDFLYKEWVMGNTAEIEKKLSVANIKKSKPTFAQR